MDRFHTVQNAKIKSKAYFGTGLLLVIRNENKIHRCPISSFDKKKVLNLKLIKEAKLHIKLPM